MPDIASGVIDFVLNPPLGSLKYGTIHTVGPGPVDGSIAVPASLGSTVYGVKVTFITVPTKWGVILGNPNQTVPSPLQLALEVELQDGNFVATAIEWMQYDGQLKLWAGGLPTNLLYHVEPGITVTLTDLVVF